MANDRKTVTVSISRTLHPELFNHIFDENDKIKTSISASGFFIEAGLMKLREDTDALSTIANDLTFLRELIENMNLDNFVTEDDDDVLNLEGTDIL